MTKPSWIDAMQEEIHKLERFEIKKDESGGVLKNKARLVAQGFRQEKGIDFKDSFTQAKPSEKHLQAVKRIFRYLKGTIYMGLWYLNDTDMYLTAYADADHAECQDTRRSTSGSAYRSTTGERVENEIMELYFIRTEYQLADIFTKPLPQERFNFLIDKLGMKSMSPDTLKRLAKETDE
nr:retrovirus-related Pol polyprotein from transposon TNT 1-94 [Tanacetum cinerariifolium]